MSTVQAGTPWPTRTERWAVAIGGALVRWGSTRARRRAERLLDAHAVELARRAYQEQQRDWAAWARHSMLP